MDVLPCGHVAYASDIRLCRHLTGDDEDLGYYRVLRGDRLRSDLICVACDERREAGQEVELLVSCEGCVARRLDDPWEQRGWRGDPGIAERPESLAVVDLGKLDVGQLISDAAICPTATGWAALSADGLLTVTGAGRSSAVRVDLPVTGPEDQHKPPRTALRASSDGRQAAIVVDYASIGVLVDTATGEVIRRLDRGNYHCEQTPFPCAFTDTPAGVVLVAATDWNRARRLRGYDWPAAHRARPDLVHPRADTAAALPGLLPRRATRLAGRPVDRRRRLGLGACRRSPGVEPRWLARRQRVGRRGRRVLHQVPAAALSLGLTDVLARRAPGRAVGTRHR